MHWKWKYIIRHIKQLILMTYRSSIHKYCIMNSNCDWRMQYCSLCKFNILNSFNGAITLRVHIKCSINFEVFGITLQCTDFFCIICDRYYFLLYIFIHYIVYNVVLWFLLYYMFWFSATQSASFYSLPPTWRPSPYLLARHPILCWSRRGQWQW